MRVLLSVALLLTLAAAGCLEGPKATPEERAAAAAERFLRDLGPLGEVRRIHGAADAEVARAEVDLTLGADGSGRLAGTMGGVVSVTYVCTPERAFLTMGGQTREMRPRYPCAEALMSPELLLGGDARAAPSPLRAFTDAAVVSAEDEGGYLTATYRSPEGALPELLVTATLDSLDRIQGVRIDSTEGTAQLTVEYGERRALSLPTADVRMPSMVGASESFGRGRSTWGVVAGDGAPLADFEVRVLDREGALVAAFPLARGEASAAGFNFTFTDQGDGTLGAGDSFTLENPAWTERGAYRVQVFDTWAQRDVKEQDVPGLGALGVLAAAGLALVAMRRR